MNVSSRATITLGNKPFIDRKTQQKNLSVTKNKGYGRLDAPAAATAASLDASTFAAQHAWSRAFNGGDLQVQSTEHCFTSAGHAVATCLRVSTFNHIDELRRVCFSSRLQVSQYQELGRLPAFLHRLTDPEASADFPPAHKVNLRTLDNRELDKLVAALGRNKWTWRRYGNSTKWCSGVVRWCGNFPVCGGLVCCLCLGSEPPEEAQLCSAGHCSCTSGCKVWGTLQTTGCAPH